MNVAVHRLSPFDIPSGTLIRFILLIVASSATALTFLSQDAALMLGVHRDEVIAYQNCAARVASEAVTRRQVNDLLLGDCHDPRSDVGLWPNIMAFGFFWLVVLIAYWCLPRWRIRRRRLRPLATDQFPELAEYLQDLQRETGVRERIIYLLEPLNPKVVGLAFGRIGRRYIMLSGGLIALFARDRPAFRMVVLHELAHVRNRDLDIAFITIVTWRLVAFLLARNLLGASISISSGVWPAWGIIGEAFRTVQNVLLTLLVPLNRNAVLRIRELYADARTALWDSSSSGMLRLFDTYSSHRRSRFGGLLQVHPQLKERGKALADARNLFTIGFWEMLAVGMLVILTLNEILLFTTHPAGSTAALNIAVLFAAPLLALGVGFSIWREAIRSFISRTPMNIKRASLGLGIGFTIGAVINQDVLLIYETGTSPLDASILIIPSLILLFLGGLFIVRWIALVARSWLPLITNRDHPALMISGTLIAISIPLGIWLYVTKMLLGMTVYVHAVETPPPSAVTAFFVATEDMTVERPGTVVIPLLLTLALLPVIGHAWEHRSRNATRSQNWITLSHPPTGPPPGPNSELHTAIRVGLLSALGGTVITQIMIALAGSAITVRHIIIIGGAVQTVAAILTSTRAQHLPSLHGIVSAFIAGSIALLANLAGWRFLTGNLFSLIRISLLEGLVTAVAWGLLWATVAVLVSGNVARAIKCFHQARNLNPSFKDKHGRRPAESGRQ